MITFNQQDLSYTDENGNHYEITVGKNGIQSFEIITDKITAKSNNIVAADKISYIIYSIIAFIVLFILYKVISNNGSNK